jgi:hypothetical protein
VSAACDCSTPGRLRVVGVVVALTSTGTSSDTARVVQPSERAPHRWRRQRAGQKQPSSSRTGVTAVGRKGSLAAPSGASRIDLTGKTVRAASSTSRRLSGSTPRASLPENAAREPAGSSAARTLQRWHGQRHSLARACRCNSSSIRRRNLPAARAGPAPASCRQRRA